MRAASATGTAPPARPLTDRSRGRRDGARVAIVLRVNCLLAGASSVLFATGLAVGQPLPAPPPATTPTAPATTATPAATAASGTLADAWSAPRAPRRRSLLRQRLRLLDVALVPLAERSRDARRTEATLNLVVGAAFITLGVVLDQTTDGLPPPVMRLLYFEGAWMAGMGLSQFAFPPARERLSEEYGRQPRSNAQERRLRVQYGEQALDDLAADGRRRRLITGIAAVSYRLGVIGILYADQIFNGAPLPEPVAFNYLVIGTLGIGIVTDLVSLLSRSPDERLRDNYRRELQILRDNDDESDDEAPRPAQRSDD